MSGVRWVVWRRSQVAHALTDGPRVPRALCGERLGRGQHRAPESLDRCFECERQARMREAA